VIEWIRLLEKEQEPKKPDLLSRPIFDEWGGK
jgi:hypothetical protein